MSYYFIAQITIKDEDEYKKYINRSDEIFAKYHGKYLAVDNTPKLLEGSWSHTRIVLISFPSENDFNDWYNSYDYQEILKFRLKAANCDTLLIKGLDK